MLQVGVVLTVNACEQLLEHPLESVIVTLYNPATPTVTHCEFAEKALGPVHE
jgi:hypothetical protein